MAKKKKTKKLEVKRCVEMFSDEVSIVTGGANGHKRFLMVKSDGDIGQIVVDDVEKSVPKKEASQEAKDTARSARSKKYGIEVLPKNSNLSYPAGAPSTERLYGDPVNLKYPLAYDGATKPDPKRTRNAIARFKQAASAYSKKASRNRIYERIVRAAMAAKIKVTVDPKDQIDSSLPGDVKTRLAKNTGDDDGPNTGLDNTEPTDADDGAGDETQSGWLDDLSKSVVGSGGDTAGGDDDEWLDGLAKSLTDDDSDSDTVPEDQETETEEPGEQADESATAGDDDSDEQQEEVLKGLRKSAEEKDAQIAKLKKSVTTLKATVGRLKTQIGAPNAIRPGEQHVGEQRDPVDDLDGSMDLSPKLS